MPTVKEVLATNLKSLLAANNMTQTEFAQRLGTSFQTVNAYIKGRTGVSVEMISKMAKVLGVEETDLVAIRSHDVVESKLRQLRAKETQKTIALSNKRLELSEMIAVADPLEDLSPEFKVAKLNLDKLSASLEAVRKEIRYLEFQYPQYAQGHFEETLSATIWVPKDNFPIPSDILELFAKLDERQRENYFNQVRRQLDTSKPKKKSTDGTVVAFEHQQGLPERLIKKLSRLEPVLRETLIEKLENETDSFLEEQAGSDSDAG